MLANDLLVLLVEGQLAADLDLFFPGELLFPAPQQLLYALFRIRPAVCISRLLWLALWLARVLQSLNLLLDSLLLASSYWLLKHLLKSLKVVALCDGDVFALGCCHFNARGLASLCRASLLSLGCSGFFLQCLLPFLRQPLVLLQLLRSLLKLTRIV